MCDSVFFLLANIGLALTPCWAVFYIMAGCSTCDGNEAGQGDSDLGMTMTAGLCGVFRGELLF